MKLPATLAALLLTFGVLPLRAADSVFGPSNPFYSRSTLPFQAPPFDKIKDSDFQPAIEAGMAAQHREMQTIAANPQSPTFENTVVAMERTGVLFNRVLQVFNGVTSANTNSDSILLDARLFSRVAAIYNERQTLKLDPESQRLLEIVYKQFVHAGANLSDADKTKLKKLNEEESVLSNLFITKLLAAAKEAAYTADDKAALAGLSESRQGAQPSRLPAASSEHDAAARPGRAAIPRHPEGLI